MQAFLDQLQEDRRQYQSKPVPDNLLWITQNQHPSRNLIIFICHFQQCDGTLIIKYNKLSMNFQHKRVKYSDF